MKHLIQLDGLRAIAVSLVMFGHWTSIYPSMVQVDKYLASAGVNLFFVLSGFLITGILLRNREGKHVLRQFYIRRFLRIFPLYYAVLFFCLLFNVPKASANFFPLITYAVNWPMGFHPGNAGYLSHLWSLAVEEQFYIFFPLLVLWIKDARKLFIALVIGSLIFKGIVFYKYGWWPAYMWTPSCFDCFGIGALLAYKRQWLGKWPIFFAALGASILLYILGNPFDRFFFAIFSFWLIGKASYGFKGWFGKFLSNPIVVYLGKISYGLYVFHHFMEYLFPDLRIFYPLITVGFAAVSWHLFEKPINGLKKYFEYKEEEFRPNADNLLRSGALRQRSL